MKKIKTLPSASYLYLLLSIGRVASFTPPFTTNMTITISPLHSCRFRVVIFHICQPMTFLTHSVYDLPGLACSSYACFILGVLATFQSSTYQEIVIRQCSGRYEDLIKQYEVFLSRMLIDILQLDQLQWLPYRLAVSPILLPSYRTWSLSNCEWLEHLQRWYASIELVPFRTPGSDLFWDLHILQLLRPVFSKLELFSPTFHLKCTFLIFIWVSRLHITFLVFYSVFEHLPFQINI